MLAQLESGTSIFESANTITHKLRPADLPQAYPVIVTAPGEEAQVDYGTGPMVRDPQSGKYRRTRLFVMTLGYSRKSIRLLVFRSSSRVWAELHEKAFRRLGGSVRIVVLDNLREGVLTPDIYDPTLNPLYRDLLAHYGVVAMPRKRRSKDNGLRVWRHLDGCVEVEAAYYSAPPGWIGRRVQVQWDALHSELAIEIAQHWLSIY